MLPPLPDDARAAVQALLQRCHGPLQHTLDHVLLEMRRGGGDGPRTKVAISGKRLRADRPDGTVDLLLEAAAWRCPPQQQPVRLDDEARRALDDLRTLIASAYLLPLYGAKAVTRQGPTVFAVEAADGTTWRLEVDLETQRPRRATGLAGAVAFATFRSTGVSELPERVELGALGLQHLRLVASDVLFEPFVFQDPGAEARGDHKRAEAPRLVVLDDRPVEPALRDLEGTLFLAIRDPGDWQGRSDRIVAAGTVLGEQGQFGAGLPFLYEEDGQRWIGLPFVPDEQQGSPPFAPRPDQDVRRRPRQRALVVYRSGEAFATASEAAAAQLRAFAARQDLHPAGPLRVLPFFNWGEAPPTEAELAQMSVQVELPVAGPRK